MKLQQASYQRSRHQQTCKKRKKDYKSQGNKYTRKTEIRSRNKSRTENNK